MYDGLRTGARTSVRVCEYVRVDLRSGRFLYTATRSPASSCGPFYTNPDSVVDALKSIRFGLPQDKIVTTMTRHHALTSQRIIVYLTESVL